MKHIKHFFIHTWESIDQLIAWFPVIWKTHDFDQYYLLEIMQFKMKRMYKFLTSKYAVAIHEECDLLALKRCINILDLLKDEKWEELAFDKHYEKFPMPSLEEMFEPSRDHPGFHVMKEKEQEEEKSFKEAMKQSEIDGKKLIIEFNVLFAKHYRDWWD